MLLAMKNALRTDTKHHAPPDPGFPQFSKGIYYKAVQNIPY